MSDKYIVFVKYGSNEHPVVVSSQLYLDDEYKVTFDISNVISEGIKFYDEGQAFKSIKKSLSYNPEYKAIKMTL